MTVCNQRRFQLVPSCRGENSHVNASYLSPRHPESTLLAELRLSMYRAPTTEARHSVQRSGTGKHITLRRKDRNFKDIFMDFTFFKNMLIIELLMNDVYICTLRLQVLQFASSMSHQTSGGRYLCRATANHNAKQLNQNTHSMRLNVHEQSTGRWAIDPGHRPAIRLSKLHMNASSAIRLKL